MEDTPLHNEGETPLGEEAGPEEVPAWEQIEAGRYMPRRIRGSCRGRSLG
jgi:hypothetical protein